jgi:hypothetical protein
MASERESNPFLIFCSFRNDTRGKTYITQARIIKHAKIENGLPFDTFDVMAYSLQGSIEITHYSKLNKPEIKTK